MHFVAGDWRHDRHLKVRGVLWALIPLLSFGLLTPVAFAYAASRLRERRMWLVTAAYAVGSALWIVGVSMPAGGWGDTLFGIAMFALMTAGTTHAFLVRRRVFAAVPPQPALRAALAARQRRAEARAIAAGDAALAVELRIGRPDLPHEFDDGGLVDVNHVPASVLVDQLDLSADQAAGVVAARDRIGGFTSPEELIVYTELPQSDVDRVRDRMLFLPGR